MDKSLWSCLMCWCKIYHNFGDILRFIRSSIHALLSAGQNKSEAMKLPALKVKRKEKKLGQIGLVLQLFQHTLLELARPLKKWPSTNDLEESFCWFSPRIHFLLSGWRGIEVHDCWFTLWPLTGTPPLSSPSINHYQQIEVVLDSHSQMCSYLCAHLLGE